MTDWEKKTSGSPQLISTINKAVTGGKVGKYKTKGIMFLPSLRMVLVNF